MAEPPITEPQAPPPPAPPPKGPEKGRLAKRRPGASATVKLARLSSLTGILFAVLLCWPWSSSIRRPT